MKMLLSLGSSGQSGTGVSSSRQCLGSTVSSGSFSHPSPSLWCFETGARLWRLKSAWLSSPEGLESRGKGESQQWHVLLWQHYVLENVAVRSGCP